MAKKIEYMTCAKCGEKYKTKVRQSGKQTRPCPRCTVSDEVLVPAVVVKK